MDLKPTLDYQTPEAGSTESDVAAAFLFTVSMLLSIGGLVPLYFAATLTHYVLFKDVPTREYWGDVGYCVGWWLLVLAMYWPALRLMLGRR